MGNPHKKTRDSKDSRQNEVMHHPELRKRGWGSGTSKGKKESKSQEDEKE